MVKSINTSQLHDGLFKEGLSYTDSSVDFLKFHLKEEAVKLIDWKEPPALTKTNFVDQDLSQTHSDLVFQCKLRSKRDGYIYVLIEHQSTPDELLSFRVLYYIFSLMNEHIKKQGNKKLPVVLNLFLYSGKKSPYPYPLDIYSCFEDPDLARKWIFKPLEIIDLSVLSEEILLQHGQADMLEILLKYGQEPSIVERLKQSPVLLERLMERTYAKSGINYILGVEKTGAKKGKSAKQILKDIGNLVPDKKDEIMSVANQLRKEGLQEGKKEGKKEGIFTVARNMLHNLHMGIDVVQQATGLSHREIVSLTK